MVLTIDQLQVYFRSAFSSDVSINSETTKDNLSEWDSINHLNLIVELEDQLNIQFTPEEIESMKSVDILLDLIHKKTTHEFYTR
jgi:acyl carrier protein